MEKWDANDEKANDCLSLMPLVDLFDNSNRKYYTKL